MTVVEDVGYTAEVVPSDPLHPPQPPKPCRWLSGKSATAVIQRQDIAPQLKEAIDDAGYQTEVIAVHPLDDPAESEVTDPHGMFCP